LKDEEAIDWCKRVSKLSLDKGNKLKEGHGGLPRKALCVLGEKEKKKEKEEENEVGERLLVLVCGGVHGKVMEKNETWNGVVCSK
jgi:hypothetical protein